MTLTFLENFLSNRTFHKVYSKSFWAYLLKNFVRSCGKSPKPDNDLGVNYFYVSAKSVVEPQNLEQMAVVEILIKFLIFNAAFGRNMQPINTEHIIIITSNSTIAATRQFTLEKNIS